jgi:uncharacterized protein (TIGR02001 family)
MKIAPPLLAASLLAAAIPAARADVSSTLTLSSDYDFRGMTQSALGPALAASLDWSGESGVYVGAWASNVDFGTESEVEVDALVGYSGQFNDDIGFDIGAVYYSYWPDDDDYNYGELYAGLSYKALSAKLWHAPDYFKSGESAFYLEAEATLPLPQGFDLTLHAGYNHGDYWKVFYEGSYVDYSIGVTRTIGKFALGLKWIDGSDLESADGTEGDVFTTESKVFFSVSTTLPW